jgi:hypothetical protein
MLDDKKGSGSVLLTIGSGSGSRRIENIRILLIRIHNTAVQTAETTILLNFNQWWAPLV